MTVGQAACRL